MSDIDNFNCFNDSKIINYNNNLDDLQKAIMKRISDLKTFRKLCRSTSRELGEINDSIKKY